MGARIADAVLKDPTSLELVDLLNKVSAEVQFRLLSTEVDTNSVGSYSVIDPPPPVASTDTQSPVELREPFRCGHRCNWCERECTRREGHRHHSYCCRRRE